MELKLLLELATKNKENRYILIIINNLFTGDVVGINLLSQIIQVRK